MVSSLAASLLLGLGLLFLSARGLAAEAEEDGKKDAVGVKAPKKKVKKPKIPPFKCSAWCAFRNYRTYIETEALYQKKKVDPSKTLQSRPGSGNWGGFGRKGQWVSLVVEVQNTTKAKDEIVFEGQMSIRLDPTKDTTESGNKPYTSRYVQNFECPPETKKKYHFSVLCPEFDFDPIEINIMAGGRNYVRTILLRDLDQHNKDLIVVVSDTAGAFKHLIPVPKRSLDPTQLDETRGREVAVVRPAELPTRWHDLVIADLIIIDGPPREGFDDEQLEALESYCLNGGRILVSPGADPSRLKAKEGSARSVADLAGIKFGEVKSIRSLDELDPAFKPDPKLNWELPVIDIRPNRDLGATFFERRNRGAERLVERVDRDLGMGAVTTLSFSLRDEKLMNWPGREQMPLDLLALGRRRPLFKFHQKEHEVATVNQWGWGFGAQPQGPPKNSLPALRNSLDASFANDTPVEIPRKPLVASFLLLYLLAAVPVNYFIFGWFKRREVAWLAVPLWAIFFSAIAYYVGYSGKVGRMTINEVCVVEAGPRQPAATARTFLCVYAPHYGKYDLDFRPQEEEDGFDVRAASGHLVSAELTKARGFLERDLPKLYQKDDGDRMHVNDLSVQTRSTRRLEVVHRVDLKGGLDVTLTEDSQTETLAIKIDNKTPHQLINMMLLHPRSGAELKAYKLGNLNKEGVLELSTESADWRNLDRGVLHEFTSTKFRNARGPDADARKRALMDYVWERLSHYNRSLVVAWIDGGVLPVKVDGEAPGRDRGLTLLIMPVRAAAAQRRVSRDLNLPLRFAHDVDVLAGPSGKPSIGDITWRTLPVGKNYAPFGVRASTEALLFLKLRVPGRVRGMVDRRVTLNFNLACVPPRKRPRQLRAPFEYSGKLTLDVRRFTGNRFRWSPLKTSVTNFKVSMKNKNVVPVTTTFRLDSSMLDENNAVWLKLRVPDLKTKGALDAERTEFTLVIKDLKPTRLSGRDVQR